MSEPSSAEKIWNHVKTLPEPLQTILKRKLGNDEISTPVRDIAKRFNLSEDESGSFETEATLVVVRLTDPATFKDDLIAEVGLNYETAVRVQRAFENEVLLPLAQEVESMTPSPASAPPPLPVVSGGDLLYKDDYLRITPSQFTKGPTTYSASKISSVMKPLRLSVFDDFGGFAINAALLVGGIIGILSFKAGWMLVGLIAGGIGFYNVKNIWNSKWWITVKMTNGEEIKIERQKKEEIDAIYSALCRIA